MPELLLTPGPTPIPKEVQAALAKPIVHHRSDEFKEVVQAVRTGLQYVFQTQHDVIPLTASGTGAMEAAICNLFKPGDQVAIIAAGKFGERWHELALAHGLKPATLELEYGLAAQPEQVAAWLKQHPNSKALLWQACETSTGTLHPTQELAALCTSHNMLSVVDAITAIGAVNIPMDAWNIDVLISGSQKAMMLPPGLCFIALSDKAWEQVDQAGQSNYYFDLKRERKALQNNQSAYTPAVSLYFGLAASLNMIQNEGLDQLFQRHSDLANYTRNACQDLGLKLFAQKPSNSLTAIKAPEGLDVASFIKRLKDDYSIRIAGGQGSMKGQIFRISHMGHVFQADIQRALHAIKEIL